MTGTGTEVTLKTIGGGDQDWGRILVQKRTVFPGPGGTIVTKYPIKCALRQQKMAVKDTGLKLFLRHLIVKKLDDYGVLTGRYHCSHVTAPYGVVAGQGAEGYIYQWAEGQETFPWELIDEEGRREPVQLEEWDEFVRFFREAGIDLQLNTVMPDSRNSQNIIHADGRVEQSNDRFRLSADWRRIDFDEESAGIDYEKLAQFLDQNSARLEENISLDRYQLLVWATFMLEDGSRLTPLGRRLEELIRYYRLSALDHSSLLLNWGIH